MHNVVSQNVNNFGSDPVFSLFGGDFLVRPHFEIFCDFSAWSYISQPANVSDTNQSWLKSTRTRFTGVNQGDLGFNLIESAAPWTPQFSGGYYCGPGNVISIVPAPGTDIDIFWDPVDTDAERFRHMFDRAAATTPGTMTIWSGAAWTNNYRWFSIHQDNIAAQNAGRYFLFIPKGWTVETSAPVLSTIRVHSSGYHAFYKSLTFGTSTPTYTEPTIYGMVSWTDGSLYRGVLSAQFCRTYGGYPRHIPFLCDTLNHRMIFTSYPNTVEDSAGKEVLFSAVFSNWDTFNFWDLPAATQFNGYIYSPLSTGIFREVPLLTNIG